MSTPHIESNILDISKNVLMPGDPKRCEYIANKYLKDVKIVNNVRNMTAYTGKYKDKIITLFPSGMGISSMGIYSYELFNFYNVEKIIRIGTCGSLDKNVKINDIILASSTYSLSNFTYLYDGKVNNEINSNIDLNNDIKNNSNRLNINVKEGRIITSDIFDVYLDEKEKNNYYSNYPDNLNYLACEMESFSLFYMANKFNRKATTLLTVVDSPYEDKIVTSKDRERSLDDMIILALESI